MHIRIDGGTFVRALPCFQSAPFDEDRRDRLNVISDRHLHLVSNTSRVAAFAEDPTKAIVLEIDATDPNAKLTIQLIRPTQQSETTPLRDLQRDNRIYFTGPFTHESLMLERLVGPSDRRAKLRWHDRREKQERADWYYVRVQQHNNHMAWSSPIWVG
jgi:hypothetical protein